MVNLTVDGEYSVNHVDVNIKTMATWTAEKITVLVKSQ